MNKMKSMTWLGDDQKSKASLTPTNRQVLNAQYSDSTS